MTRDEILALSGKRLFGCVYDTLGIRVMDERDIKGAWQVVEKMQAAGFDVELSRRGNSIAFWTCWFSSDAEQCSGMGNTETVCEAICEAALIAKLEVE